MHWSFNPVGGVWLVTAIAVGLLALAALRPGQALAPGRRWTLVTLRVAAVLMLLFAMLRPEVVTTRVETLRAALLILIDSSKSMTVEDSLGDDSRWDAAVRLLDQSADSLQQLSRQADVELFQFDDTLRPVTDLEKLDSLRPTGEGTTLGRSLGELLDNEASERLLGVILLSDGAQRAPPGADLAPQVAARRFALEGTPIFPFAFGTPSGGARADVAIDDLVASESVFAGTPTQVSGSLRVRGYANQTLTVQLLWEDDAGEMQVVDAAQVPAGPAGGRFPVSLSYTPLKSGEAALGEKKVELRVAPQDGEVLTSNNSQSTFVTVREGGVKVLYLAGAKRPGGGPGLEQKFIRASLASSPDIVVTRRLVAYTPPLQDLADELARDEYDVYVLDDVDADAFDRDTWAELADRVRDGAGLMMIGGYHSFGPGGHASSPLVTVLPVTPGRLERQRFDEPLRSDVHLEGPVKMRLAAPFGPRHPIMQISPEPAKAWAALPPLDGANRLPLSSLKPNATVLAEGDSSAALPLLVAGQPGQGRCARLCRRQHLEVGHGGPGGSAPPLLAPGDPVARPEGRIQEQPGLARPGRPPRDARRAARDHRRRQPSRRSRQRAGHARRASHPARWQRRADQPRHQRQQRLRPLPPDRPAG